MNTRLDAGKAVAPYTNRKKPTEIEQTNTNVLADSTDAELEARIKELGNNSK
jgi:hypothetical protein